VWVLLGFFLFIYFKLEKVKGKKKRKIIKKKRERLQQLQVMQVAFLSGKPRHPKHGVSNSHAVQVLWSPPSRVGGGGLPIISYVDGPNPTDLSKMGVYYL
jgi:hypothetical protein